MKRYFSIFIICLITFNLIGCSVKSVKKSSSENVTSVSNNNDTKSKLTNFDNTVFFMNSEAQCAFWEHVVVDNDIDYDYSNESYDMTTQNMIRHQQKYANIWQKELEYSIENFLKFLAEEDKAEFKIIQANWETSLKAEYQFVGDIFVNNENYSIHMGSIFHLEMLQEYLGKVRERTLYVKYLHYCIDVNGPNNHVESTVHFNYKSLIR